MYDEKTKKSVIKLRLRIINSKEKINDISKKILKVINKRIKM